MDQTCSILTAWAGSSGVEALWVGGAPARRVPSLWLEVLLAVCRNVAGDLDYLQQGLLVFERFDDSRCLVAQRSGLVRWTLWYTIALAGGSAGRGLGAAAL